MTTIECQAGYNQLRDYEVDFEGDRVVAVRSVLRISSVYGPGAAKVPRNYTRTIWKYGDKPLATAACAARAARKIREKTS